MDLLAAMPFAVELGIELVDASPDEVRARLAWDERRCTAGRVLHGGALMTLADSTGAILAYLNLPEGANATATIGTSGHPPMIAVTTSVPPLADTTGIGRPTPS